MKKIHLISMLLLVVGVFCSCTNKDYQKAIPADASLVMKVEFGNIAQKADFLKSEAMKTLEQSLEATVKNEDMKKMKAYLDDPMEMGLDFLEPAYFFMVGMETFGLTMKVEDEGALKDFITLLQQQGMATKPVEKDGLMCGTLIDEIHYSYDANACLLIASPQGQSKSATSRMVHELMNQKESDSFLGTDGFDRLNDTDGDVTLYTNVGNLPKDMVAPLLKLLPDNLIPKDLDIVADLKFEDGKATLKGRVYGNSNEAKNIIQTANDELGEIDGAFLDKVSDNMMLWASANVKGKWLLEHLKADASIKEMIFMMERAIDIEQMVKAVDGDLTIEVQQGVDGPNDTEYVAYAQLNNTDFLNDVDYWKQSMKDYGITMTTLANNQYQISVDDEAYVWGVEDKNLFIGTVEADRQMTSNEDILKPYAKDIKNSKVFLFFNLEPLAQEELSHNPSSAEKKVLESLKAIVAQASSVSEISITVILQNEDENFLKQLF